MRNPQTSPARMYRRVAQLEMAIRPDAPAVPTWEEYRAANDRWYARGERWMRELFGGWLAEAGVEANVETGALIGLPELWHPDTIAANDALLVGDTEEQRSKDDDIRKRWHKAKQQRKGGIRDSGYNLDSYADPKAQAEVDRVLSAVGKLMADSASIAGAADINANTVIDVGND